MLVELLMAFAHWAWVPIALSGFYWLYLQYLEHRLVRINIPTVDASKFPDYGQAMIHGMNEYKQGFQLRTDNESIVSLPIDLFPETEKYGEDTISLQDQVRRRFLGDWTHLGVDRPAVIEAVRMELTRNVDRMLSTGILADETEHSLSTEIGPCEDWKPVKIYMRLLDCVSMISGRIFVGLPLCREQEWKDISILYTVNAITTHDEATKWSPFLRPIVAPFLPSVRKCREQQRKMEEWMRPLLSEVRSRREDEKHGREVSGSGRGSVDLEARGTFITWVMNHLPESMHTAEELSISQLLIGFAAIHTTTTTATMALYDLACRPELVEMLREEMNEVDRQDKLEKNENGITIWPKQSLSKLWKFDSFLKESQRINPLSFSTPERRVLRPITFSNGLHLPKGTLISFPAWAIHHSSTTPTFSPCYNANTGNAPTHEFDALRFYRLRQIEGRERKHQTITTSCDSLNFGHGHHACPGRFFATYEIKMLLMAIIQTYDIRCEGDEEEENGGGGGVGGVEKRPKNLHVGPSMRPDPTAPIMFRRRRV